MQDFTRWQFRDVQFLVRVSDISGSSNHLIVDNSGNSLDSKNVAANDETLEHVDLSSLDFVVLVLFVPQSVFVEPVVNLGLGVNGVSEVGRSRRSNPEFLLISAEHVVDQLLVLSIVVLLDDTEVSACLAYSYQGLLVLRVNLLKRVAYLVAEFLRKN